MNCTAWYMLSKFDMAHAAHSIVPLQPLAERSESAEAVVSAPYLSLALVATIEERPNDWKYTVNFAEFLTVI